MKDCAMNTTIKKTQINRVSNTWKGPRVNS